MDAGERNQLITFERATATVDDYGGEASAWATYATAWALVLRGTGAERREASQEVGSQQATFDCDWTPTLDAVKVTDRINYRGDVWDITDAAPSANRKIQFTAIRAT